MDTRHPPFDSRDLRNAFGCFATGVTVVTARGTDDRLVGVTANSFSSVSLDPPIVSWNLGRKSPSLQGFEEAGRFIVNILAFDQEALSNHFAGKSPEKFVGMEFDEGLARLPILRGCTAVIECRTIQTLVVGDHVLFLGEVEQYRYQGREPLIFCQGAYLPGASFSSTSSS